MKNDLFVSDTESVLKVREVHAGRGNLLVKSGGQQEKQ